MKKLIAALMAVAILLSLCACGSASAPKKKSIEDITSEDLEAAAERLMEDEEETVAQATEEVPPIEDYLVTIEITPENFSDYFELFAYPVLDDWGTPKSEYYIALKCNLNDQGLIYYRNAAQKADDDFLMEMKYTYYNGYGTLIESTSNVSAYWLYDNWCMGGVGSLASYAFDPEKDITAEVLRTKGTLTFLKEEYIQEVVQSNTYKQSGYEIISDVLRLKNGERLDVRYYADRKY